LRTLSLLSVALMATPAVARTTITPYIEVQQVFSVDLSGNGSAVTYTGLAGGVDASFDSPKFKGQLDYSYDHYFSENKRYRDTDIHNGLASFLYQPNSDFSIQASGIATRARGSLATASAGLEFGNLAGTQQIYGIQAGPSYKHSFGNVDTTADYRFGWVRSTNGFGTTSLGPGQPALQNDFTTLSHTAGASIGMRPGTTGLPFGWKVSGGYENDQIHYLDSRYIDKFGRVDLTFPITDTVALEAGAGYEAARASQSAILIDGVGDAVLDDGGHLIADRSKPRLLSYDESGLVWDVGVLWRPSVRTELEIRGGQRYGQVVVTGHLTHQLSERAAVQVVAYDDIESFGRQLTGELGALPTSFTVNTLPFDSTLNTCVLGANGGQGGCLSALNSVNSNFYRSRGVYALLSGKRGLWIYGLGVGYDNRRYIAPTSLGAVDVASFNGVREQSVTVDATIGRRLSQRSQLTVTGLVAWYDNDTLDVGSYTSYGVVGTYSYEFSRRLIGSASFGISSGTGGTSGNDVAGTGLLALRYQL
jgi:uncharacterized protein (PEP-CTERM system associated)